jgi:putative ABC transport system permease protein
MLVFQSIRIAFNALRENRLRTFLTLLGNIVGTMAIIAVVSLIGGIDNYAREKVAEEGSFVFDIERVNFFEAITDLDAFLKALKRNKEIRLDDVDYLREWIPSASYMGAAISSEDEVSYGDESANITIRGWSEEVPLIEKTDLESGRHVSRLDVQRSSAVAVVGWDVYQRIFDGKDPVGRKLKIGRKHYLVIGVVKDLGTVFGQSRNRFVIIPVTTFLKNYGSRRSIDIKVRAADIGLLDEAIDEATMAMRIRHKLRPTEENDFAIITSEQLISLWKKISSAIFMALTFIAAIALVIGGIVLMNIMLVAVTERTREIGIRKALGARRSNIVSQFMVESVTLSVIGGIIGIILGFSIASIVSILSPLPYVIAPWSIAAGLIVTFVIGLVFGTYPANRASKLDPVEALHHE